MNVGEFDLVESYEQAAKLPADWYPGKHVKGEKNPKYLVYAYKTFLAVIGLVAKNNAPARDKDLSSLGAIGSRATVQSATDILEYHGFIGKTGKGYYPTTKGLAQAAKIQTIKQYGFQISQAPNRHGFIAKAEASSAAYRRGGPKMVIRKDGEKTLGSVSSGLILGEPKVEKIKDITTKNREGAVVTLGAYRITADVPADKVGLRTTVIPINGVPTHIPTGKGRLQDNVNPRQVDLIITSLTKKFAENLGVPAAELPVRTGGKQNFKVIGIKTEGKGPRPTAYVTIRFPAFFNTLAKINKAVNKKSQSQLAKALKALEALGIPHDQAVSMLKASKPELFSGESNAETPSSQGRVPGTPPGRGRMHR